MDIYPKNNHPDEIKVVNMIETLIGEYSLEFYTNKIMIVRKAPYSRAWPLLTLTTHYRGKYFLGEVKNRHWLLSLLVHENLHWMNVVGSKYGENKKLNKCVDELEEGFPETSKMEGGVEHLPIFYNQFNILKKIVSSRELKMIFSLSNTPYPDLMKFFFANYKEIGKIVKKWGCIEKRMV